jgi:hypothetical protein
MIPFHFLLEDRRWYVQKILGYQDLSPEDLDLFCKAFVMEQFDYTGLYGFTGKLAYTEWLDRWSLVTELAESDVEFVKFCIQSFREKRLGEIYTYLSRDYDFDEDRFNSEYRPFTQWDTGNLYHPRMIPPSLKKGISQNNKISVLRGSYAQLPLIYNSKRYRPILSGEHILHNYLNRFQPQIFGSEKIVVSLEKKRPHPSACDGWIPVLEDGKLVVNIVSVRINSPTQIENFGRFVFPKPFDFYERKYDSFRTSFETSWQKAVQYVGGF